MDFEITHHAFERMKKYRIPESMVEDALENPDSIVPGHSSRMICQKRLNGHLLRIVVENNKGINRVITTYKSRRNRYEI